MCSHPLRRQCPNMSSSSNLEESKYTGRKRPSPEVLVQTRSPSRRGDPHGSRTRTTSRNIDANGCGEYHRCDIHTLFYLSWSGSCVCLCVCERKLRVSARGNEDLKSGFSLTENEKLYVFSLIQFALRKCVRVNRIMWGKI